jgi:transposase
MRIVYQRCCGLDVHKNSITACLMLIDDEGEFRTYKREFGTMTRDLKEMSYWLESEGVQAIAMEATGVYWKPVWNILEAANKFTLVLVNAQHIKNVPGRKTDQKDSEWIAELLQHGLLRASFVPPLEIRRLRDLTRLRAKVRQTLASFANRIQKVLEDANIKLGSVASDVLGASGRHMLKSLVAGQRDPKQLAELAQGRLREKKGDLQLALEGHFTEHHRLQIKLLLEFVEFGEKQMSQLESDIRHLLAQVPLESPLPAVLQSDSSETGAAEAEPATTISPLQNAVELWDTIPGIDELAASTLVAEIGADMDQFPTAAHLASWAGLCPGNDVSAGKRRTGKTRKGSVWLRRALCQAAWAASRTKDTYLAAQYKRMIVRKGKKRTIVAVAHSMLVMAYYLQKRQCTYQELGGDYFDRLDEAALRRRLVKRLVGLGYQVDLTPICPEPEPHTSQNDENDATVSHNSEELT